MVDAITGDLPTNSDNEGNYLWANSPAARRRIGRNLRSLPGGWSDPGAADVVRRDLTDEALVLARLVTELLPDEPEALGLLALLLHAEARRRARRNANGNTFLLPSRIRPCGNGR